MRTPRLLLATLAAAALAVAAAASAEAHDGPLLTAAVERTQGGLTVRVTADDETWALGGADRAAAARRAVALLDAQDAPLAWASAGTEAGAVLLRADAGPGERVLRFSLFGGDEDAEAVVTVAEAAGPRLLRLELPGRVRIEEPPPVPVASSGGVRVDVVGFFLSGVHHVTTGYDHLAFLLTLLVVGRGLKDVVKVVTAFTLAHSLTLGLAAADVVRLPSGPVEAVIAASIVVAAVWNLLVPDARYRALVALGFGLVHGLGFSSAIAEALPAQAGGRAAAVAAFNVGVEAGQVGLVLLVFPLLLAWRRLAPRGYDLLGRGGLSLAAGAVGAFWLVERTFA